ncbi:MAG TPA: hypothetical protein VGI64_11905 [Streptosporangiaceae bacterium]
MPFTEKFLRYAGAVAAGGRQVRRYHVAAPPSEIGQLTRSTG